MHSRLSQGLRRPHRGDWQEGRSRCWSNPCSSGENGAGCALFFLLSATAMASSCLPWPPRVCRGLLMSAVASSCLPWPPHVCTALTIAQRHSLPLLRPHSFPMASPWLVAIETISVRCRLGLPLHLGSGCYCPHGALHLGGLVLVHFMWL